jgi:hypothetical protein
MDVLLATFGGSAEPRDGGEGVIGLESGKETGAVSLVGDESDFWWPDCWMTSNRSRRAAKRVSAGGIPSAGSDVELRGVGAAESTLS